MDYKKKSLKKLSYNESYEEIDTRLASGWYVETKGGKKTKQYKTKQIEFINCQKIDDDRHLKISLVGIRLRS